MNTHHKYDTQQLELSLLALLKALSPTEDQLEEARKVLSDTQAAISEFGARVEVLGSWRTGLCIPTSDMDFFVKKSVTITGAQNGGTEVHTYQPLPPEAMHVIAKNMRTSSFKKAVVAPKKNLFVVTGVHNNGKNFEAFFAPQSDRVSQYLCGEFMKPVFKMARGLIILVKGLVASWSLDDPSTGGLGSFPISIMALWFLHQEVQKYPEALRESYAVCLMGFLKYYGWDFDYERSAINYVNQGIIGKIPSSELHIMNPIDPTSNCAASARKFSSSVVPNFRKTFELLSGLLEINASVNDINLILSDIFELSLRRVGGIDALLHHRKELEETSGVMQGKQHLWDDETMLYIGNPTAC